MVITELVQNAVEHGYGATDRGRVEVRAQRRGEALDVVVADDGAGLPPDFALAGSPRLGLQIVRTLVEGELRGTLSLGPGPEGGTQVRVAVPLEDAGPDRTG
jgi:two-component sensor histidine kinase